MWQCRRPYRSAVAQLWQNLERNSGLILPTDGDVRTAWDAYGREEAPGAGVVDHVSFAVMRRLRLTEAFTNDRHFRAAGFTLLF